MIPENYLLFHIRGDLAAEWTAVNPIIPDLEIVYDRTNKRLKIGDGVTPWNALPWLTVSQAELDKKYTLPTSGIPISDLDSATRTAINNALLKANNLSDLASATTARTNLGLKGAAVLDVGTASGTVAAGDDSRFTNARAPSAGSVSKTSLAANLVPYDLSFLAFGPNTTRAVGYGDNPLGVRLSRAITIQGVFYRCGTAAASGNMTVELRKNGTQIAGTSLTIASGNMVAGIGATGLSVALSAGDVLTVYVTATGTTPGKGLVADIQAAWT